jgi:hypothetical protein
MLGNVMNITYEARVGSKVWHLNPGNPIDFTECVVSSMDDSFIPGLRIPGPELSSMADLVLPPGMVNPFIVTPPQMPMLPVPVTAPNKKKRQRDTVTYPEKNSDFVDKVRKECERQGLADDIIEKAVRIGKSIEIKGLVRNTSTPGIDAFADLTDTFTPEQVKEALLGSGYDHKRTTADSLIKAAKVIVYHCNRSL